MEHLNLSSGLTLIDGRSLTTNVLAEATKTERIGSMEAVVSNGTTTPTTLAPSSPPSLLLDTTVSTMKGTGRRFMAWIDERRPVGRKDEQQSRADDGEKVYQHRQRDGCHHGPKGK